MIAHRLNAEPIRAFSGDEIRAEIYRSTGAHCVP